MKEAHSIYLSTSERFKMTSASFIASVLRSLAFQKD